MVNAYENNYKTTDQTVYSFKAGIDRRILLYRKRRGICLGLSIPVENPCKDKEEYLAWRALRRIGAVGLLWDKNSTAFLGIDLNAEKRKRILACLTEDGSVLPMMVEGIKVPFYYRSEDDSLMCQIFEGQADLKPRMSFLAPLDPLLWDKSLILSLWDYRYSWEIYTPAVKRKYGSYTLPILFGDWYDLNMEQSC